MGDSLTAADLKRAWEQIKLRGDTFDRVIVTPGLAAQGKALQLTRVRWLVMHPGDWGKLREIADVGLLPFTNSLDRLMGIPVEEIAEHSERWYEVAREIAYAHLPEQPPTSASQSRGEGKEPTQSE